MPGLKKGTVELLPHNERWHNLFDEEKRQLENAVGANVLAIEHIGSTSICGIAAAIEKYSDGEKCIKKLEKSGYEYRGENGISERHYIVKGEPRTHHLHIVELGSDVWRCHLLFRAYLRQHPKAAAQYDNLKKSLTKDYFDSRDAYLQGKTAFIEKILKDAGFAVKQN